MKVLTTEEFNKELYERCLAELYQAAQPPITLEELENSKGPEYMYHYLSNEECKYIIEKYIELYNLENSFKDHCDIIMDDMIKGCSKDKYIPDNGDTPGYRSYEKVPPLSEEIGEENLQKVIDFIKMRKDFYRFNRKAESFRFNMLNYSPNSNKEKVIELWKEKGVDLVIEDRNPEFNFERYYLGCSEEHIKEEYE